MKIQTLLLLFSLQSQQLQWFRINVLSNESSLECCHSQKEKKFQIKKFHHMEYDTHTQTNTNVDTGKRWWWSTLDWIKFELKWKFVFKKYVQCVPVAVDEKKMGQNERISIKKKLEIWTTTTTTTKTVFQIIQVELFDDDDDEIDTHTRT